MKEELQNKFRSPEYELLELIYQHMLGVNINGKRRWCGDYESGLRNENELKQRIKKLLDLRRKRVTRKKSFTAPILKQMAKFDKVTDEYIESMAESTKDNK